MDIPPHSPIVALSPSSPPPPYTVDAGSSSAPPDWYQKLTQHLDTISLDMQAQTEDNNRRFREIMAQQAEILQIMQPQFPPPPLE